MAKDTDDSEGAATTQGTAASTATAADGARRPPAAGGPQSSLALGFFPFALGFAAGVADDALSFFSLACAAFTLS